MTFTFPEPKRRHKNKNQLYYKQIVFSREVWKLDGQCMNPDCPCKKDKDLPYILTAHHIIRKGQGGWYVVENGICLCAICHEYAEGRGNLMDEDGNRITALAFVLSALDYWEGKPEYRWENVHAELRRKAE